MRAPAPRRPEDEEHRHDRLASRERERRRDRRRVRGQRLGALVLLVVVGGFVITVAFTGSTSHPSRRGLLAAPASPRGTRPTSKHTSGAPAPPRPSAPGPATGRPGHQAVPILTYHVIATPPPGAPFPKLYVPRAQFADQMQALARAGWRGVTLDQVHAYWARGARLPKGRPIVLTFDNGYRSHYAAALPVLRRLGWPADENIQLSGLPPSQGGLTESQVRALLAAGWELDTQGFNHADLVTLDATRLRHEVAQSRAVLRQRYHVPVNWFCYPSGHYDPTVVRMVRSAGYTGSTTTITGWASPTQDRFRLERIRALGGTSGAQLVALLEATRHNGPPPAAYAGG